MSLSKNTVYNILGSAFPSLLMLVTIPLYLNVLGVERYGFLTLCTVVAGYAGILDVGLGLAATRKIAALRNDPSGAADVFWTSAALNLVAGLVIGFLIYFLGSLYFQTVGADSQIRAELSVALPVLALMVPFALVGGTIGGALAGRERFLTLNVAAAVASSLTAALPLLVAYLWSAHLAWLVTALLVARLLPMPFLFAACRRAVPLGKPRRPVWTRAQELVSFGGWMSLTLAANSVLQTLDRLLIGSRIGAGSVPIYAIPYGLVSRIILIPHSISAALFPRYAYVGKEEQARLSSSSIRAVAVIITPGVIALIGASEPFLRLWIGAELAVEAAPVAYVLASGFWFYCIGHMAYSMLQSIGRPDLVAKVLLAELAPYAVLLFASLLVFGVVGAAAAFTVRAMFDCAIFLWLASVPGRTVRWLALPLLMVVTAVLTAAFVPAVMRYVILGSLMTGACVWSLLNIPDVLRPYLGRFVRRFSRTEAG